MENNNYLSYCTYGGAVGDGVTDDFEAMKRTHERANLTGQTVVADPGKKFNVGQHAETITVKTDCIFTNAEIIIDDSPLKSDSPAFKYDIFRIAPENESFTVEGIDSLHENQKNIGKELPRKCLLLIENANKRQYIRYGLNQNNGSAMKEVIVVDKDGTVDELTPIMWEYDTITNIKAYPCDDKPITLQDGTFITVANTAERDYAYCARGISITRSNVTVRGASHLIIGEGENSDPYSGFFNIRSCNNTLLENVVLTGHKTYKWKDDNRNSMGTYEFGGGNANSITLRNVTQTNDINDNRYWGVMGTNYCKNITYDHCILSRFDAHSGVFNATIKDSEIGHQKLAMIGLGTMIVENVKFTGNNVICLRGDYGSTWRGDIHIKNVTVNNKGDVSLISGGWVNHNFGYKCYVGGGEITVDGVHLADNTKTVHVISEFGGGKIITEDTVDGEKNRNPVGAPKKITILSNKENVHFDLSPDPSFKNVPFEIK